MNFAEYCELSGVNFSTLKHIDPENGGSPLKFKLMSAQETRSKDTPAMKVGRCIDARIFDAEFIYGVWAGPPNTSAHKSYKAECKEKGLEVLNATQSEVVDRAVKSIETNETVCHYLKHSDCDYQVTLQWTDPATGIKLKGRTDCIGAGRVTDLKSTAVGWTERALKSHFRKFMYWEQVTMYTCGAREIGYDVPELPAIAVTQTVLPWDSAVFVCGPNRFAAAKKRYEGWLATLATCMATNHWPGAFPKEVEHDLETWELDQLDISEFPEVA